MKRMITALPILLLATSLLAQQQPVQRSLSAEGTANQGVAEAVAR